MSSQTAILLLEMSVFLLVCFYLGYLGWKRSTSLAGFFVADRKIGSIVSFLTYSATLFSTFTLVGMPGFFYTHGIGSWAFIAFADVFMAVMIYVFGRRFWLLGRKFNFVTPTEFLCYRYDSTAVMALGVLISFVFLLPYVATQLVGIGKIVEGATGGELSYLPVMLLFTITVLVYTGMGGMRAVAWNDAVQGVLLFVMSFGIAFLFLFAHWDGPEAMFREVARAKPALLSVPGPHDYFTYPTMISYFFLIVAIPITQPQMSCRFFIPRSLRSMRFMMMATPVYAFLILIPALILGLGASVVFPNLSSGDLVLSQVLSTHTSAGIGGLVICGVVAAAMSTVSGQLLVLGSLAAKDLYLNLRPPRFRSERGEVWVGRVAVLLAALVALLASVRPPALIVELSIQSFAGTMQLLPVFVGGLYWRKANKTGALASMMMGIGVFCLANWGLDKNLLLGFHPGVWGVVAGSVGFIAGSLLTQTSVEERQRAEIVAATT
ncbi:MAG: sodium:solute symporter family protein [Acidobacteria bacterium]|nr:sodium:solute symporter family protein [Acidobacteriota bacterium]